MTCPRTQSVWVLGLGQVPTHLIKKHFLQEFCNYRELGRGSEWSVQHSLFPCPWASPQTQMVEKSESAFCPWHQTYGSLPVAPVPHTHWASKSQLTSDTKSTEAAQTSQDEGSIPEDGPPSQVLITSSTVTLHVWPTGYKFAGSMIHLPCSITY